MATIKNQNVTSVSKDGEKLEVFCTTNRTIKWYVLYGTKKLWLFLKKLKIRQLYDPTFLLLGIFTKVLKTGSQTVSISLFIAALFTIVKR